MDYHQELIENGLSATPSRVAIFRFLHENDKGITAEEIYLLSQKKNLKISLATTYRTLAELEHRKLIKRVVLGKSNRGIYRLATNKISLNLINTKTGKSHPFEYDEKVEELLESLLKNIDEKALNIEVNVYK
ncbi:MULTISPECIES: Fur family transcriptional regulator [Acinetobacter calcoaceticus/baumannii complex]|uniref:Transcriptional repressor n=1 Tax=Acinetobacter lactucae TaxID=1785128 RepID=A0A1V0KA35_9GAMM|nr:MULTISPECIES: transcriptional repressor [Acinetobacter calcoaceticus/baumannii complex]ARD28528.1 transcriptional repressor [Acinetobacter lactucae]KQE88608.1 Fur family transcriptional regulator [Acinetobacter lactucae]MCG9491231.1 transcriptional repressor [Acinetobacter pittii]MCU4349493.1 transcriptional repressor [Acinetobacter lactucae]QWZ58927.1 transcriptional repressor [Acinetobacter pittii]